MYLQKENKTYIFNILLMLHFLEIKCGLEKGRGVSFFYTEKISFNVSTHVLHGYVWLIGCPLA